MSASKLVVGTWTAILEVPHHIYYKQSWAECSSYPVINIFYNYIYKTICLHPVPEYPSNDVSTPVLKLLLSPKFHKHPLQVYQNSGCMELKSLHWDTYCSAVMRACKTKCLIMIHTIPHSYHTTFVPYHIRTILHSYHTAFVPHRIRTISHSYHIAFIPYRNLCFRVPWLETDWRVAKSKWHCANTVTRFQ